MRIDVYRCRLLTNTLFATEIQLRLVDTVRKIGERLGHIDGEGRTIITYVLLQLFI